MRQSQVGLSRFRYPGSGGQLLVIGKACLEGEGLRWLYALKDDLSNSRSAQNYGTAAKSKTEIRFESNPGITFVSKPPQNMSVILIFTGSKADKLRLL